MRIAVDATCWANQRGYGRFAREIVNALARAAPNDQFLCLVDDRALEARPTMSANVEPVLVKLSASPTMAASAEGYRSLRDLLALTRRLQSLRCDVFFSPSVYTYFPLPPRTRAVVTIHDVIAERFPHLTTPSRRSRILWWMKVRLARAQANLVLTVSDHAARDIARVLKVPEEKIRVAVEAPAAVFTPRAPDVVAAALVKVGLAPQQRYFTYVGGFNPHKRLDVIVAAHAALVRDLGSDAPRLLFVGAGSEGDVFYGEAAGIRDLIQQYGTSNFVIWTGYLDDATLAALHTGSLGNLLVSECEGFGLPAVESAACGSPVIATTESPLPELLAGGGFFVEPNDQAAVERGMRQLLDPAVRSSLGEGALQRAGLLTWERAAAATHAALVEAAQ